MLKVVSNSTKVQKNCVFNFRWVAMGIRTRHMVPLLHGGNAIDKREATRWLQVFFIPGEQRYGNRILVICLTKGKIQQNLSNQN